MTTFYCQFQLFFCRRTFYIKSTLQVKAKLNGFENFKNLHSNLTIVEPCEEKKDTNGKKLFN